MSLRINDVAPSFMGETTRGGIGFHDWTGNGWNAPFLRIAPQPE